MFSVAKFSTSNQSPSADDITNDGKSTTASIAWTGRYDGTYDDI